MQNIMKMSQQSAVRFGMSNTVQYIVLVNRKVRSQIKFIECMNLAFTVVYTFRMQYTIEISIISP